MEICKVTNNECSYCTMGPCESRRTVIDKDERRGILQAAINTYGANKQVDMVIEEMAELTKALLKQRRPGGQCRDVLEEMADVQIMLDQLKLIYGWDREVEMDKLVRLQRMVDDAQKG